MSFKFQVGQSTKQQFHRFLKVLWCDIHLRTIRITSKDVLIRCIYGFFINFLLKTKQWQAEADLIDLKLNLHFYFCLRKNRLFYLCGVLRQQRYLKGSFESRYSRMDQKTFVEDNVEIEVTWSAYFPKLRDTMSKCLTV